MISRNGGRLFVMGPPTGAVRIPLQPGTVLEGVRMRAAAARRLLDASPADLWNAIVPLDDVLRAALKQAAAASNLHVDAVVSQLLRRSLPEHDLRADSTVRSAITWLGTNWRSPVEDMSKHVNRSNRDLRRRFMAAVGMGPKLVQRMVRVQHALHLLRARTGNVSLSDLAFECGFADQAHMTREVAHFTDHTPSGLRRLAHSTEARLPSTAEDLALATFFKTNRIPHSTICTAPPAAPHAATAGDPLVARMCSPMVGAANTLICRPPWLAQRGLLGLSLITVHRIVSRSDADRPNGERCGIRRLDLQVHDLAAGRVLLRTFGFRPGAKDATSSTARRF